MKVFLTGATGYIGHQLALQLAAKNFTVHALVRNLNSPKIPVHENIKLFKGDICDYQSIERAIQKCQYVFHVAAFTNLKCKKIDGFYKTNVLGTKNLLEASKKYHVKKVIYTSTLSVFGPSLKNVPITELQPRLVSYSNDYELTKSMSEELVQEYSEIGLPCGILNVSRVYGPGLATYSNGVNKLILKIMNDRLLIVPSELKVNSNYVFINDVVHAHLLAMKQGLSGEKYIIGGENIDYSGLFEKIINISRSEIFILRINYKFMRVCLAIIDKLSSLIKINMGLTPKILDTLFTHRCASSKKAIIGLNYKITPLDAGLKETISNILQ
jgi:nucleoside-diphosphate-sugar epimerase